MPKLGPRGGTGGPKKLPRCLQDPPEAPSKPQTPGRPEEEPPELPKTARQRPPSCLPRAPY
eukprot:223174-Pyramimonas_sp.AAC.1